MSEYEIFTDSSCDLPQEMLKQYGIIIALCYLGKVVKGTKQNFGQRIYKRIGRILIKTI